VSVLEGTEKHLEVVVDDSQLSLAIGKKGQNVRLAAKLLGWKIDIKSEEEKRQEVEQQMSQLVTPASTPLADVPGLGEGLIEKLGAAGVTTVEALADMTPEQLEAIEGIGPKTVEKISLAVNNYFSSLEGGEVATAEGEASVEVSEGQETSIEGDEEAVASEVVVEDVVGDETAEIAIPIESAGAATEEQTQEPAEEPASSEGKE
jgi:N utilization substance protein A